MRLAVLALALVGTACSPIRDNDALAGKKGDACEEDLTCGAGLVCGAAGECTLLGNEGTAGRGDACASDTSCRFGLVCNSVGQCGEQRTGEGGDRCLDDTGCAEPLICSQEGKCAEPGSEGTIQEGGECEGNTDCAVGLVCSAIGRCAELPKWSGTECEPPTEEGAPRVHFQIPRGGEPVDFFRLPYPNNARRFGERVDLGGFPGLERRPEPGELISRFTAAVKAEAHGFSTQPAVIFRFSHQLDYDTLKFGGEDATFVFVDVTPDLEAAGRRPRSRFFATTDRSRYVCHNWLGIRPSEGSPLEPGHTYAVFFRKGLEDENGTPLEPDEDFAALLKGQPPEHPALENAWRQYQPFRTWIAAEGMEAEEVLGGTVFTVDDPRRFAAGLRSAVHAGPVPEVQEQVICDGGTPSPCEGPQGRTCGDVNPLFHEVHLKLGLPNYMTGVPPYTEGGGGGIQRTEAGPKLQRQESVCAAVTIPRGATGSTPILIFNHDIDGHFRSFVANNLATRMATLGWSVISIDAPLHGSRFGTEEIPEAGAISAIIDNFERPAIMRDQPLQAAADLFALTRLLGDLRVQTADGNARFGAPLAFFGHGRGGEAGVIYGAYEPAVSALVFAGTGGGMVDLLRLTRSPVNLGAQLEVSLADPELNGMHPALHLLQHWLDPRDPVNYGRLLRSPPEDVPAKHVFMLYGVGDEVTPPATMNQLAIAARLQRVGPDLEELEAVQPAEGNPVRGNVNSRAGPRTQVIKQYEPESDGRAHDVALEQRQAIADLNAFFEQLAAEPEAPPGIGQ